MVSPKFAPSGAVTLVILLTLGFLVGACDVLKEGYSFFVDDSKLVLEKGKKTEEVITEPLPPPPPLDPSKLY